MTWPPTFGRPCFRSAYRQCSYARQHLRRPQIPESFPGIQGQVLVLGHPDADGSEPLQEGMAADRAAAGAGGPQDLGLVPHADLAQLDSRVEVLDEVFDQLAEVHAAVGGEVEHRLAGVQPDPHLGQFHGEAAGQDALPAEGARLALPLDQGRPARQVGGRGLAKDRSRRGPSAGPTPPKAGRRRPRPIPTPHSVSTTTMSPRAGVAPAAEQYCIRRRPGKLNPHYVGHDAASLPPDGLLAS